MNRLKCIGRLVQIFILTFITSMVIAQNNRNKVLFTSQEIFDSINENRFDIDKASVEFSIIGDYVDANLSDIKSLEEFSFDVSNDYSIATKNIFEKSKNSNILIINESHNHPEHRRFLRNLLDSLYEQGYRYLAIEALTNNFYDSTGFLMDTSIYERGFPLFSKLTGTYTREPEMGKLIRKSIDLGFKLVAYERIKGEDREFVQANNIFNKVFKNNKYAKLIVLCGYYHVFEKPLNGKKWMANYLKELSEYDPLTIYQLNSNTDSSLHFNFNYPVVFNNYKIYNNSINLSDNCDIWVFHPVYRNFVNIPEWKFSNNGKIVNISPYLREIFEDNSQIDFPFLVRIFYSGETFSATPYEILEINSLATQNYVYFEKNNKYTIEYDGQTTSIIVE